MRRALEPALYLSAHPFSREPPRLDSLCSRLIEAAREEGPDTGEEEEIADPQQRQNVRRRSRAQENVSRRQEERLVAEEWPWEEEWPEGGLACESWKTPLGPSELFLACK